jgi:hypothetical protein
LSKAFCGIASSPSSPIDENLDIGRFWSHVLTEDDIGISNDGEEVEEVVSIL